MSTTDSLPTIPDAPDAVRRAAGRLAEVALNMRADGAPDLGAIVGRIAEAFEAYPTGATPPPPDTHERVELCPGFTLTGHGRVQVELACACASH